MNILLEKIYNLLLYLKEDIIAIYNKLSIIEYFNQKRAEEADKNVKTYFQNFEKFYSPLEDDLIVIFEKYRLANLFQI